MNMDASAVRGTRTEILARQAKAMSAAGLDAIVACSPENFA